MKMQIPAAIRVVVHQEDDGSYWADSVDAPGCFTVGETIDDTLHNMQDAVRTHFELPPRTPIQLVPRLAPKLTFA